MKSVAKYIVGALLFSVGLIPNARAASFTSSGIEAHCVDQGRPAGQLITNFYFDGSTLESSRKILFHSFLSTYDSTKPLRSVSNDGSSTSTGWTGTVYTIEKFQRTSQGAFEFALTGGGSLLIQRGNEPNSVQIFFVRPNGPEFPQILNHCELLRREVGATAHN